MHSVSLLVSNCSLLYLNSNDMQKFIRENKSFIIVLPLSGALGQSLYAHVE